MALSEKKLNRIEISSLHNVNNPLSIHGIYPYRGKISALDASLIIKQLENNRKTLLDPFCGSGTIIYEANKNNINSIGVDLNPLAIWISKGKIASLNTTREEAITEANKIITLSQRKKTIRPMNTWSKRFFHDKTAKEIMNIMPYYTRMSDYTKAAFLGTIALSARGCNHYKWTSSTVGKNMPTKNYIDFYKKFIYKVRKHSNILNAKTNSDCTIFEKDSRELSDFIKPNSIDYIFTSPPYFDALDYTAYYGRIIYDILGKDHLPIKKDLIQNAKEYKEDMNLVFKELLKVTKKNALIIFVVGDKKVGKNVINGGEFFSEMIHHKPNQIIERSYSNSSSKIFDKLNNTQRKEQIVVWDKSTWK